MTLGYFFWLVLANAVGFGIGLSVVFVVVVGAILIDEWGNTRRRNRKRK